MKSKPKSKQQPIKSDFYTILMWFSLIGTLTYIATLWPSYIRGNLGSIPLGWYGYWIPSAVLFATGFVLALRRKKLGAEILIAISLADAFLPLLLFSQIRKDGPFDAIMNTVLACAWLIFLRIQPKFLSK